MRGLKHDRSDPNIQRKTVAPYTGAWIETDAGRGVPVAFGVAPYTGAWIETYLAATRTASETSHPIRVRGLKHCC